MSTINEDWRELRPKIGTFISKLEGLTKGYEDIETLLNKTETRAYEKGFNAAKKDFCKDCELNNFYNSCNGYYSMINRFMGLSDDSKHIVLSLIDKLSKMEDLI